MCHLFLDTSQAFIILGLSKAGVFYEKILRHENKMGTYLASSFQSFLNDCHISLKELETISCGVGPGSYTGTRVGLAFAEALAFGLDIPLIKIPSLMFFLNRDEKSLMIRSNFNSFGCLTIENQIYSYNLIENIEAYPHTRILDPKDLNPAPCWQQLTKIQPKTPLNSVLYYALT